MGTVWFSISTRLDGRRPHLVTAPLHASHEENHSNDTEKATDVVDLTEDLPLTFAL